MKKEVSSDFLDQVELFDKLFRFKVGDSLRHKADTKDYTADMGLLVIARVLVEEQGDDPTHIIFKKQYHCRMIRFSGSGEIAVFRENELVTIQEYNQLKAEQDVERHEMREEAKQSQRDIYNYFGVTKNSEILVKADTSGRKYRPTGFAYKQGDGYKLKLRSIADGSDVEYVDITSKDQIEVLGERPKPEDD